MPHVHNYTGPICMLRRVWQYACPAGMYLWVARRSRSKPTWPGMLDHIVAGAQPFGISCYDNVIKEAEEEVGRCN